MGTVGIVELRDGYVEPSGKMIPHGYIKHQRVSGVDCSGLVLDNFGTWDVHLTECSFERVKAKYFSPGEGGVVSEFVRCSFDRATLRGLGGGMVRFVECSFRGARLSGWNVSRSDVVDCDFEGARLRDVMFWAHVDEPATSSTPAESWDNEIRGNDFSGATLMGVEFRTGVDLSLQKLPVGEQYLQVMDVPAGLERGREAAQALEGKDRFDADFLLKWIATEYQRGQRQAFMVRMKHDSDLMWTMMRAAMHDV
ncbi:pentapeptide repeat-containing protein [Schaalia sp. 19OD2882]|uniref:pentapeptide repeat-containing protein n=1 Tax=Schaalia sp. 19OD2882 TaxID=2794089 RepID=UPI001C1EBB8F|nr:pentapeptide repeat-containing protein [Schaalia sp. 19OD2882]QWW19094.1 pentapeptide repeat-containing protein [Schaalia sp. 19OD2882]